MSRIAISKHFVGYSRLKIDEIVKAAQAFNYINNSITCNRKISLIESDIKISQSVNSHLI
jgi:hypothetical protein